MKTNKLAVIILCVLFGISNSVAQTNYYNVTKAFNENGYVYQCNVHNIDVSLYNKSNLLMFSDHTYKDGKPVGDLYREGKSRTYFVQDDTWTKPKAYSIVNGAFSATEKQRLKDHVLSITMYINSDSGNVVEVEFGFLTVSGFATIPVSVYRKIETDLKSQIWFTPTAEGKKLNYLMHHWMHEVE